MAILFTNLAASTLAAEVTSNSQTSLTLATGHGALFPNPTGSDVFYLVLDDGTNSEIVKCTSRSTDTLTVVRGQEGTTAQASFAIGTRAELRLTAAGMAGKAENAEVVHLTGNESIAGIKTFSGTTASTSTTTGTVVVGGGIGVAGAAFVGGAVSITSTTASTSTTTGALTVSGGLGVAGAGHFGSSIYSASYLVPHIAAAAETYTPAAAGTATLDCSKGNKHFIQMPAGNVTIAISNVALNQCLLIRIKQDSTGSRTVTWFSTISWAGGSAPTLTTTANKTDIIGIMRTGAGTYDGFVIAQNI